MGKLFIHQPCNSDLKTEIKDINSNTNDKLSVIEYWLKNIKEYLHLWNNDNMKRYEKPKTCYVTNSINSMVKHIKSMEQVITWYKKS